MPFLNLHISEHGIPPHLVLARRIVVARTASKLSQSELADIMHVTQKTVSSWEIKGNIPAYMLGSLAEATQQDNDFFMV